METYQTAKSKPNEYLSTEKRYGALRIIATIYQGLGWLVIVGGLLVPISIIVSGVGFSNAYSGYSRNIVSFVVSAAFSYLFVAITGLGLLAFSQFISAFLSMEETNRETLLTQKHILHVLRQSNGQR